jgi:uncharacterized protein YfaS (alpha-2-macroglobulin family)
MPTDTPPPVDPAELRSWEEIEALADDQKLQEAQDAVLVRLQHARNRGDEAEWTRALVQLTQLRIGLHGYETAVRLLMEQPWPQGLLHQAVLNLFYARSLVTYVHAYQWEIRKRERVVSAQQVDLKAWTVEQLYTEAQRAYQEVWRQRELLGAHPVGALDDYLHPNIYPREVRGTLRDSVTYLRAELFADTTGWRPEHQNELFRLDLPRLLAPDAGWAASVDLVDPGVHPLVRLSAALMDLELWHQGAGRPQAALEARLERLRHLHAAFTDPDRRALIRADLEKVLPGHREHPWWAMGMSLLGELQRDAGMLVRARDTAASCAAAYPQSLGGQRCLHLHAVLEAPDFTVQAMSHDGAGERSVQVTHKNLPALHFRAYEVDLERRLATARDYNLLPSGQEMRALLSQKPAAVWTVELPPTPDLQSHQTFSVPPLTRKGAYVVLASPRKDFAHEQTRVLGTHFILTGVALVTRVYSDGTTEASMVEGETGKAVAAAEVTLYRYDYQRGHTAVETRRTDKDGVARFESSGGRRGHGHFVLGRRGVDLALDPQGISFWNAQPPPTRRQALVYTDRSIYRPMQKAHWKVIAFEGSAQEPSYRVLPGARVTVSLHDGNGQQVESKTVTTNTYGSGSGDFDLPAGRVLGAWSIRTSPQGQAQIRVEEYKRPTFVAELKDPEAALRLNRPATFTGEARYYFGLPVAAGKVRWRVTREPRYPWWWGYWGMPTPDAQAQVVATGDAALSEDGRFQIAFTPEAEEPRRKEDRLVTWSFRVVADVTDEGGETRTAERSFRLGWVAVEARVDPEERFFTAGTPPTFVLARTDLDGAPRPGKGSWRLVAVDQPARTLMPAELPLAEPGEVELPPGQPRVQTPGDLLPPRWGGPRGLDAVAARWPDVAQLARGDVEHDARGQAKLKLPPLPSGLYRLRYETQDAFGERFETHRLFVVAGEQTKLAVPLHLAVDRSSVTAGQSVRVLVTSGLPGQRVVFEVHRAGRRVSRRELVAGASPSLLTLPVGPEDRGGFSLTATVTHDYQLVHQAENVFVPWDDRELKIEFATFRDRIRPGAKEKFTVTVTPGRKGDAAVGASELLAYMYDEALDLFAPHRPPGVLGLYPSRVGSPHLRSNLGAAHAQWVSHAALFDPPPYPMLSPDVLRFHDNYGIGGPGARHLGGGGVRTRAMAMESAAPGSGRGAPASPMAAAPADEVEEENDSRERKDTLRREAEPPSAQAPEVQLRADFSETAFWQPHLLTGPDGSATLEFTVPDSVTSWNVWVHAVTRDLRGGSLTRKTRSVKDLMVRPYVPRFLREGDQAALTVNVNNASDALLRGQVELDIVDLDTQKSLLAEFGLTPEKARGAFEAKRQGGATLTFPITTPARPGQVAVRVVARSGNLSDGELRPVPVLPGRLHLAQSRFVTLHDQAKKTLTFEDMARPNDPSLTHDQLVVTIDAQLFYTALGALPYLVDYPYECTEQTLNRFVSTGVLSSLYGQYPAVARMAKALSERDTVLETWDGVDPNRKLAMEETPWLVMARGGEYEGHGFAKVLDPKIARAERDAALAKLRKWQTASGGFPWFPGGPPSPYMTLYLLHGFARAAEYGVEVPKELTRAAWGYVARHFREEYADRMLKEECCWEFLTFLNYVASSYPDASSTGGALTDAERKQILDHTFRLWKKHSPYLKGYLTLTLQRMGRAQDARKVWASVMDSARTTEDEGTFWAAEDRSWLWYNDRIETHAFALQVLMALDPDDARRHGLVQWLLINKKLNHWKSTRSTAEVIYALVKYLEREKALGIREELVVEVGPRKVELVFSPETFTGKKNQVVVPGPQVDPATMSRITVAKETRGFAFASATWHFATDRLPDEERVDFFVVSRRYFKRERTGRETVLQPLAEGARLEVGDELEIQLSIRSKHAAEYVHLRDPRAAGLEPENAVSRYKWDLGISWYEETRDSGTNFFFEWLPAGEYTFKYRLRANLAGEFRVGPATLQSMYAPEFNAYSTGQRLRIGAR